MSDAVTPLVTRAVEKVWGRGTLPAPFASSGDARIGEIWFEPAPPVESLLAKYLFTSEKLSVQVHPGDADAPAGGSGKEECWLVLDADPGASLAIGFHEPVGPERIRAAARDGSIEDMLVWHPAQRGDFFYLPAGTVHAIGPGLTLVEIQQNSDITYRLYDYGRPRDLHLDQAMTVAHGQPHDPQLRRKVDFATDTRLVDGPAFTLDYRVTRPDIMQTTPSGAGANMGAGMGANTKSCLLMPLAGDVRAGGTAIEPGTCVALADCSSAFMGEGAQALFAYPA